MPFVALVLCLWLASHASAESWPLVGILLCVGLALYWLEQFRIRKQHATEYSVKVILVDSASREAVAPRGHKKPLGAARRQWHVLGNRRNTADDRFTARPKGATRIIQYGVAVLEKDTPFPADCALS